MTLQDLQAELSRLGVTPPDAGRALFYLKQLQDTHKFLWTDLAQSNRFDYAKVKSALQDPELLNTLSRTLDEFVGSAINADLMATRPASLAAYYNQFLDADSSTNAFAGKITPFYQAYAATGAIIENIRVNFCRNIEIACRRLLADWGALERAFLPVGSRLSSLSRIKSSGSDFHKGGTQVLLLTFHWFTHSDGKDAPPLYFNLVYKPSDLEGDCLIAGDTQAAKVVNNYPQEQSLFEILNGLVAAEKAKNRSSLLEELPTYKVLPMKYGSSLQSSAGKLDLRSSYGYLEFLYHQHFEGPGPVLGYYLFGSSDYKIFKSQDKDAICRKFYRLIGQYTAIACTFSMIDLHVENIIVKNYLPYLIDLEISLTETLDQVTKTSLFGGIYGGVTAAKGPDKLVWQPWGRNIQLRQEGEPADWEQNRLWTVEPPAIVDPADYAKDICKGFYGMMQLIKAGNEKGAFRNWLARLKNVIVRYLAAATPDLRRVLTDATDSTHCRDWNGLTSVLARTRGSLYSDWTSAPEGRDKADPNLLAVQDSFVTGDYQNADIPIFYYRITDTSSFAVNIMNSEGKIITIPGQLGYIDGQNAPQTTNINLGSSRRGQFFVECPTQQRVGAQLAQLRTNFEGRTRTLIRQILIALGKQNSSSDINALLS